jgi:murein DD-endopeptidase MepM/ murein hydrolase activator NlpD
MPALKHFFIGALLASLLTGCTGNSSIWGTIPTPTPFNTPDTLATEAALAGPTPAPSLTPLMVLPMQGSPTPGGIAVIPGTEAATPTLPPLNSAGPLARYSTQGGDTLQVVAKRFGVGAGEIISDVNLPAPGELLPPGTLLLIPNSLPEKLSPRERSIPDSEIPYSPSAAGFDITAYVNTQNGYLAVYNEYLMTYGMTSGAHAVQQISWDNSLNPRILLAIIEYESHWVLGQPTNLAQEDYPLGYYNFYYKRLFRQMMWASGSLSNGYYRWRSGDLTELTFSDGSRIRLDPQLNAGTAAIQYFFSLTHDRASWEQAVSDTGFPSLYRRMFGDPWERAAAIEPTIPAGLTQPALTLPFEAGRVWSFSGGPHSVWEFEGGAQAAIDFAPAAAEHGCVKSDQWIVAPANGVVARASDGVVMLDLDGDGVEQTGWDILFLHVGAQGRVRAGAVLKAGDHIGHASCEGGAASGTHVHIARKYNGEWMLVDGPLPFNMDGWIAHGNGIPYKGTLTRGEVTIEACACGTFATRIIRDK